MNRWKVYLKSDSLWLHAIGRFATLAEAKEFAATIAEPTVITWD